MSQLVARQHVNFRVFENAYYQYEQELLEPETWKRYRIIIQDMLKNNKASHKMWIQFANSFTDSFQNEIEQIKNEDKALTPERNFNTIDSLDREKN